jgi:hypothetical protein
MMRERAMPYFTSKQRFKIALGGFMSLVGFIILALAVLVITETIEIENILQSGLFVGFIVVIGVLDVLTGILLIRFR